MTELTVDELDIILARHNGEIGVSWEDPDVVTPDTKKALLDWHNKEQVKLLERLEAQKDVNWNNTTVHIQVILTEKAKLMKGE